MQLIPATDNHRLQKIEQLYQTAFPACERKPFSNMTQRQATGQVDIFALEENGAFHGLAITMKALDLVLLDYFAIADAKRGQGFGHSSLQALIAHYAGKRFFLEIESTREPSPNREQRLRRKSFHLRGGMTELGIEAVVFGVPMELLSCQAKLTAAEYVGVYETVYGAGKAAHIQIL